MTATAAIAVLMGIGAAAFVLWCVVSCSRWMRRHHPRGMATRRRDEPRADDRSSIEQFKRIHRP